MTRFHRSIAGPALGIFVLCAFSPARAQTAAPGKGGNGKGKATSSEIARVSQRYLDGLFRAKPHLATFMGDHRFDGALPDLSAAAVRKRSAALAALASELAKLEPGALDDQLDVEIMQNGVALERLYLDQIRDWEWDPRLNDSFPYYDPREMVAGRLSDIIHGDHAPPAERRKSVTAQLRALPRFLSQASAALEHGWRHPAREYVDQAIKGNKGRIEFFETELEKFTGQDPPAEAARKKAVEALRRYQTFLETPLAKKADGDWRLGAALYARKFPLALQTSLQPAEVVSRAEVMFRAAKSELYAVARKLHGELWPAEPGPPPDADATTQKRVIERVKDQIAGDHAKPDELVAAHARNLDELRAFIEKHNLLRLPPRETLVVEPMPAFKRGSSAAEYLAPGVLEKRARWKATYYVDPIDPTWPPDRVESYLRGQNNYEVQLVAAHEAYPGHHTQFAYARDNLVPLRATLWNAPMVEGWAVYGEGLMVQRGWGGTKNDRFRFYDLRGQMIVATNAILDVKLQGGQMTDAEAVRFMVEEGFQESAMASKKLLRAKLDSTQLVQYFLGYDEIRALERDYRKQVGERYDQRVFNESLVGHGSIAVKLLRRYLLH
jgi:uncharacterized protein (DUF885 family)